MLDLLRKLFVGGSPSAPHGGRRPTGRPGEGRRAWEGRRSGRASGWNAPGRAASPASSSSPLSSSPSAPDTPIEEACKTCGAPLLVAWGGICPRCRPNLASPKTLFGSREDLAGAGSLTLGWLVVLGSPDAARRAALLELAQPTTVLTSTRGNVPPGPGVHAFDDEFVSSGHALLRRPGSSERTAAFTLEDRRVPGPSSNGTFLNSRKLARDEVAPLADGDLVRIGTTELLFKSLWLPPGGPTR